MSYCFVSCCTSGPISYEWLKISSKLLCHATYVHYTVSHNYRSATLTSDSRGTTADGQYLYIVSVEWPEAVTSLPEIYVGIENV